MLAFSLSCINTSLQCGANSVHITGNIQQPVHPSCSDSHSPVSSQTLNSLCVLFYHTFFCLASHRNCFSFASNTIEATCLYFRSKQNSAPSAMQIMALFHLTLNPWQQSCLDHAARTGTRAMAVSVLHAQASAMQQQIVFIQTTYLKNKSGVTRSPFTGPLLCNQVPPQEHMQDSNSQRGESHALWEAARLIFPARGISQLLLQGFIARGAYR